MARAKLPPKLKKALHREAWPKSQDPLEVAKSKDSDPFPSATKDEVKSKRPKSLPRA